MSERTVVGVLHPGAMGSSIGAALVGTGHDVRWAAADRSSATAERASTDGLRAVADLAALVDECATLISVCPPAGAIDLAKQVADLGFAGTYLDANAVSPTTARQIGEVISAGGATFIDGGIVGPPARHAGLTVIYLSGDAAATHAIADTFRGSPCDTFLVGTDPGAASALKMAFAAWTKGTSALLLAIRALAEAEGVSDALDHAWSVLTPDLAARLPATVSGTAPKAWRFVGEMEEIAATFAAAGLPSGFHDAAADVYGRLADLRDRDDVTVADVTERLR
jgi:3-hydroxyisobutyrate dehydrogenase-like beta-hydroxyacid dehydrogenase